MGFRGGDDGNRTRVRKEFAGIFSERSRYFRSPPPHRLTTGYTGRQLLMCDGERSRSLFTFTSDRRPLRGRGTPRRDGLHQAAILTVFLSVIFKFTDFMAVPHRRSLIRGRSPRRSLYIPICAKLCFAVKFAYASEICLRQAKFASRAKFAPQAFL